MPSAFTQAVHLTSALWLYAKGHAATPTALVEALEKIPALVPVFKSLTDAIAKHDWPAVATLIAEIVHAIYDPTPAPAPDPAPAN